MKKKLFCKNLIITIINDNDDDNDNEFFSAYPFYMKLALCPKIIYTKKKYCTMRYRKIIS